MSYPLYIAFGVLPSLIWLLFYLRKDVHPESNRMIIIVFILGMLSAPLAVIFECLPTGFDQTGLKCFSSSFFSKNFPAPWDYLLYTIFAIDLVEELAKYLVVRTKVLKNSALDEPTDVMLYMIIAGLGFAALENILYLYRPAAGFLLDKVIGVSLFRFFSAVFLHALTSATFGYFLACSFYETKKRLKLFLLGLGIAVFSHALYNFSIMKIEGELKFLIPIAILLGLAVFVSYGFRKLQKLKGVCKII